VLTKQLLDAPMPLGGKRLLHTVLRVACREPAGSTR
jgi:hypothetical protein